MARPKQELTQRELEVMQVYWRDEPMTASDARDRLAQDGRELTYTTVANLCRTLFEKRFLKRLNKERPIVYAAKRSFDEVAKDLFGQLIQQWFGGDRHGLLMHLFGNATLTNQEREFLQKILDESLERSRSEDSRTQRADSEG